MKPVYSYPIYAQPIKLPFLDGETIKTISPLNAYDFLDTVATAEDKDLPAKDTIKGDTAPVSIKYKGLPHAVVSFNYIYEYGRYTVECLPSKNYITLGSYNGSSAINNEDPFYKVPLSLGKPLNKVDNINSLTGNTTGGYLWLGEIYKDV